ERARLVASCARQCALSGLRFALSDAIRRAAPWAIAARPVGAKVGEFRRRKVANRVGYRTAAPIGGGRRGPSDSPGNSHIASASLIAGTRRQLCLAVLTEGVECLLGG